MAMTKTMTKLKLMIGRDDDKYDDDDNDSID